MVYMFVIVYMVYMFVSVYKLPSTHQTVHNLLGGRTTFSPVPSSTRSVPETPSLQCWSVLSWRLNPCCMMRALCIDCMFSHHIWILLFGLCQTCQSLYPTTITLQDLLFPWTVFETSYTKYVQFFCTSHGTKVYNISQQITQHISKS